MEISTEINKDKNIRRHTIKGVIDTSELTECLKEIYSSPDFDPEMNSFWDLQQADFSCISSEDVRLFKEYIVKQWGTEGKSKAVLVVSDNFEYGMSRMFQMMMEEATPSKVAVFKDINEAREWIETED